MTSQTPISTPAPRRHQHPRKRSRIRAKLFHQTIESFFAQPPQANADKAFSEAKTRVNLFLFNLAMAQ